MEHMLWLVAMETSNSLKEDRSYQIVGLIDFRKSNSCSSVFKGLKSVQSMSAATTPPPRLKSFLQTKKTFFHL